MDFFFPALQHSCVFLNLLFIISVPTLSLISYAFCSCLDMTLAAFFFLVLIVYGSNSEFLTQLQFEEGTSELCLVVSETPQGSQYSQISN